MLHHTVSIGTGVAEDNDKGNQRDPFGQHLPTPTPEANATQTNITQGTVTQRGGSKDNGKQPPTTTDDADVEEDETNTTGRGKSSSFHF